MALFKQELLAFETCIADADAGKTKTSPLDPDTDHGGVKDGTEDANHDGVVDGGETDPNDPADDRVMSGGGAGGMSGAGGASGLGGGAGIAGVGGNAGFGGSAGNQGTLEGGGCSCGVAGASKGWLGGWLLGIAGLGLWVARRRRAQQSRR